MSAESSQYELDSFCISQQPFIRLDVYIVVSASLSSASSKHSGRSMYTWNIGTVLCGMKRSSAISSGSYILAPPDQAIIDHAHKSEISCVPELKRGMLEPGFNSEPMIDHKLAQTSSCQPFSRAAGPPRRPYTRGNGVQRSRRTSIHEVSGLANCHNDHKLIKFAIISGA